MDTGTNDRDRERTFQVDRVVTVVASDAVHRDGVFTSGRAIEEDESSARLV